MKKIIYTLAILALVFSSCVKQDVYDPEASNEDTQKLDSNIDESFDWAMFKPIKLTINASENDSEDYYSQVYIYDASPLYDAEASLLASGVYKKGQSYVASFDVPSALTTLYIERVNPQSQASVVSLDISSDSDLDYTFASASFNPYGSNLKSSSIITSALSGDFNTKSITSYVFDKNGALEISSSSDIEGWGYNDYLNTVIYVPEGLTLYTSNINFSQGAKLKIDGTLVVDSDLRLQNNGYIEVFSKGQVEIMKDKTLTFTSSSNTFLAIQKGGRVYSEEPELSGNLEFNYNNELYNEGNIEVYSFNSNGTDITNYGSFVVKDKMETSSSDVIVGSGAYIEANNWDLGSTNLLLEKESVIYVKDTWKNSGGNYSYTNTSYVEESDGDWAYIIAKTIDLDNGIKLSLYGNLKICTDSIIDLYNNEYRKILNYKIIRDKVEFSLLEDCPTLPTSDFIPSTLGNSPGEPEDVVFPLVSDLTNLFTFVTEDTYPEFGDYDMNDLVIDLSSMTTYTTSQNLISKVEMTYTLRAYGALHENGFAVQLSSDIQKSNIKSISVTNQNITNLDVENNMISGNSKIAIPLFDNCENVFNATLVNTKKSVFDKDDIDFVVTIEFNNPVSPDLLTIDNINPFLFITTNNTFVEVHVPGFEMFSKDENMPISSYMWALKIPKNNSIHFLYPIERMNIKNAYSKFILWIQDKTNVEYQDWYKYPTMTNVQDLRE